MTTSSSNQVTAKRIPWAGGPSITQNFSFRSPLIRYITENPSSSKAYQKMIQSCKYFFEKNPIIVAKYIHNLDGIKICSKDGSKCNLECCIDVDFDQVKSKFWITDELFIQDPNDFDPILSSLLPKIYRCDNNALLELVHCTLNEFKKISSFFERIDAMQFVYVKYDEDRSPVMVDKIIEIIPHVKKFKCNFNSSFINNRLPVTSSILKNISNLMHVGSLRHFELHDIPEFFDVKDLQLFIEDNKNTKIVLHFFSFHVPFTVEYKNQLDQLIDYIIESKILGRLITYPGEDKEKLKILEKRF